jgi:protein-S-isoprenylcysteine O-methyltransferase Ste14
MIRFFRLYKVRIKMAEQNSSQKRTHFSRAGEHPFGDIGQLIFLFIFLFIWILDSFVLNLSTFLENYVPLYIRLAAAGLILLSSIYLVRSGHRAISSEVLDSPRILRDGAFSRVRHPLYLAALLFYVFLFSISLSLISLVVFIGIFVFYNSIASYEERFLQKKFGQEYLDYKKNTAKWLPRLF